jgi:hypothetical protein
MDDGTDRDRHRDAGDAPAADEVELPSRGVLDLDHVYEALGHPRRRYLCYTLLEDREWSLADLATKIAAWENGVPEHAVTDRQRDRVYVSLYHAHIPKLVETDVVAFDDRHETIAAAANADQVLAALRGIGASLDASQETHARSEMDEPEE